MIKVALKNDGIQQAVLLIGVGVGLSYVGFEEYGRIIIGAAVAYIVGKLQRRPVTVAQDDIVQDEESA